MGYVLPEVACPHAPMRPVKSTRQWKLRWRHCLVLSNCNPNTTAHVPRIFVPNSTYIMRRFDWLDLRPTVEPNT